MASPPQLSDAVGVVASCESATAVDAEVGEGDDDGVLDAYATVFDLDALRVREVDGAANPSPCPPSLDM